VARGRVTTASAATVPSRVARRSTSRIETETAGDPRRRHTTAARAPGRERASSSAVSMRLGRLGFSDETAWIHSRRSASGASPSTVTSGSAYAPVRMFRLISADGNRWRRARATARSCASPRSRPRQFGVATRIDCPGLSGDGADGVCVGWKTAGTSRRCRSIGMFAAQAMAVRLALLSAGAILRALEGSCDSPRTTFRSLSTDVRTWRFDVRGAASRRRARSSR
jgi:hypothetical protein